MFPALTEPPSSIKSDTQAVLAELFREPLSNSMAALKAAAIETMAVHLTTVAADEQVGSIAFKAVRQLVQPILHRYWGENVRRSADRPTLTTSCPCAQMPVWSRCPSA